MLVIRKTTIPNKKSFSEILNNKMGSCPKKIKSINENIVTINEQFANNEIGKKDCLQKKLSIMKKKHQESNI